MSSIKLKPFNKDLEETMNQIVDIAKKSFNKSLLLVGAKGSVARNDFTPYSDFDILIIVNNKKYEQWPEFMYNTTYFDIQVVTLDEVLSKIENLDMYWPGRASGLVNLKVYYDKKDIFGKIQKSYNRLGKNTQKFENAISLNTITEYYAKAVRYYNKKEYESLRWATFTLFEEFSMMMALLNHKYSPGQGPTYKIAQMEKFSYKPKGWLTISKNLTSINPKDNIDGANKLYNLCHKLSKKHKFGDYNIKDITEIKFKK
jgi:predicted nucleotidyltransferase